MPSLSSFAYQPQQKGICQLRPEPYRADNVATRAFLRKKGMSEVSTPYKREIDLLRKLLAEVETDDDSDFDDEDIESEDVSEEIFSDHESFSEHQKES
ncbi:hypothetical protein AVEN_67133-1 [Araneus ventricosus]|uniref:Uncharacterized protein n=1 Tax=Araneus ventricosus TaxID=182803 RepID=A0A4Y2IGX5_ARAVE|nr:hypothetical protein AVEN_67133-1 [Araneus ventricosus]